MAVFFNGLFFADEVKANSTSNTLFITSFDDLDTIPARTTFDTEVIVVPGPADQQQSKLINIHKASMREEFSSAFESGDVFVLEINGTDRLTYTYTGGNLADELATLITSSTEGDWAEVDRLCARPFMRNHKSFLYAAYSKIDKHFLR